MCIPCLIFVSLPVLSGIRQCPSYCPFNIHKRIVLAVVSKSETSIRQTYSLLLCCKKNVQLRVHVSRKCDFTRLRIHSKTICLGRNGISRHLIIITRIFNLIWSVDTKIGSAGNVETISLRAYRYYIYRRASCGSLIFRKLWIVNIYTTTSVLPRNSIMAIHLYTQICNENSFKRESYASRRIRARSRSLSSFCGYSAGSSSGRRVRITPRRLGRIRSNAVNPKVIYINIKGLSFCSPR